MGCRYRTGVLPGIPGGDVRAALRRHGHPRWSPLLSYSLQWSAAPYWSPLPIKHYHISISIPTTPAISRRPPTLPTRYPLPPPPRSTLLTDGDRRRAGTPIENPHRRGHAPVRRPPPPPQAQQRTLQLARQPPAEARTRERERTPTSLSPIDTHCGYHAVVVVRHHAISSPSPASPTSTAAIAAARRHSLLPPPALASPASTPAAVAARCCHSRLLPPLTRARHSGTSSRYSANPPGYAALSGSSPGGASSMSPSPPPTPSTVPTSSATPTPPATPTHSPPPTPSPPPTSSATPKPPAIPTPSPQSTPSPSSTPCSSPKPSPA